MCGAEGNRTPDPRLAKAVLYQLSYSPGGGLAPAGRSVVGRTRRLGRGGAVVRGDRRGRLTPEVGFGLGRLVALHDEQNAARDDRECQQLLHRSPLLSLLPLPRDATARGWGRCRAPWFHVEPRSCR